MKFSKLTLAIVVALLLAGGYIFYSLKNRVPFSEQDPAVNANAPEISLADLSGRMISLSDFKGKVILVNFWASWCPPCKAELSDFQKVFDSYEDKGFAVIGIVLDDVSPALIKDMGITFPIVKTNERVSKSYGNITDVPASLLVGKDGRIIKKLKGVYSEKELSNDIENALKAKS